MSLGINEHLTPAQQAEIGPVSWTPSDVPYIEWYGDLFKTPAQIAAWCKSTGWDGVGLEDTDATNCAVGRLHAVRAGRVGMLVGVAAGIIGMCVYARAKRKKG